MDEIQKQDDSGLIVILKQSIGLESLKKAYDDHDKTIKCEWEAIRCAIADHLNGLETKKMNQIPDEEVDYFAIVRDHEKRIAFLEKAYIEQGSNGRCCK